MRRTILIILLLLTPPAATIALSSWIEQSRYPRRFAEVVPGRIYRGGFPSVQEVRHLRGEKSIRAIVSLTGPTDRENERAMLSEAQRLGITLLRFPMPGDGRGDYEMIDRAAEAVAKEANWPVYFHCAAGKQRSNAVLAAYRLKYCGWSVDEVRRELVDQHGLDVSDPKEAQLWQHIKDYAGRLETETAAKKE